MKKTVFDVDDYLEFEVDRSRNKLIKWIEDEIKLQGLIYGTYEARMMVRLGMGLPINFDLNCEDDEDDE